MKHISMVTNLGVKIIKKDMQNGIISIQIYIGDGDPLHFLKISLSCIAYIHVVV
jgi:hypothetical protein